MLIYNMFVRKQRENNNQEIIKHTLNVMDIKLKDDEIELIHIKERTLMFILLLRKTLSFYPRCNGT